MLARGAYGLNLPGCPDPQLLNPGAPGWPSVELIVRPRDEGPALLPDGNHGESVFVPINDSSFARYERRANRSTLFLAPDLPEGVALPYWVRDAGQVFGSWLGRASFHAGGFASQGRAWGLVGEREAGKSSTLAYLSANGYPIIADDVLLLDGTTALAAARCLFLRDDAPAWLPPMQRLGVARGGTRWRLLLPAVEPETPLAGWVYLEWGANATLTRLGAAERLRRVSRALVTTAPPESLLALAQLPAWVLTRPRRPDSFQSGLALLLDLIGG